MCRNSSSSSNSSSSHFLFSRDFSVTIEDTDIINTPLEPLRPADVPFKGFVDIASHFAKYTCVEMASRKLGTYQNNAKNLYTIYFVLDLDGECKFVKTKHYSD